MWLQPDGGDVFPEKKMNWRPLLIMLYIFVAVTFAWSLRPLVRHKFDQDDITVIMSIGLAAMTGIVWRIKRFDETGR